MRARKVHADSILYNMLLSMCADVGLIAEAEQLFRRGYTIVIQCLGKANTRVEPLRWSKRCNIGMACGPAAAAAVGMAVLSAFSVWA